MIVGVDTRHGAFGKFHDGNLKDHCIGGKHFFHFRGKPAIRRHRPGGCFQLLKSDRRRRLVPDSHRYDEGANGDGTE